MADSLGNAGFGPASRSIISRAGTPNSSTSTPRRHIDSADINALPSSPLAVKRSRPVSPAPSSMDIEASPGQTAESVPAIINLQVNVSPSSSPEKSLVRADESQDSLTDQTIIPVTTGASVPISPVSGPKPEYPQWFQDQDQVYGALFRANALVSEAQENARLAHVQNASNTESFEARLKQMETAWHARELQFKETEAKVKEEVSHFAASTARESSATHSAKDAEIHSLRTTLDEVLAKFANDAQVRDRTNENLQKQLNDAQSQLDSAKNETNLVKQQAMGQAAILQQQYMELENDLQVQAADRMKALEDHTAGKILEMQNEFQKKFSFGHSATQLSSSSVLAAGVLPGGTQVPLEPISEKAYSSIAGGGNSNSQIPIPPPPFTPVKSSDVTGKPSEGTPNAAQSNGNAASSDSGFTFKSFSFNNPFSAKTSDGGTRVPLSTVTPIVHTSSGVQKFDIADQKYDLDPDLLNALDSKLKMKPIGDIELTTPQLGVMSLVDWQYEAIQTVAAAGPDPGLTIAWMQQTFVATHWDQLEDPKPMEQLGIQLAKAVNKILPPELKREIGVIRAAFMMEKHKLLNGRQQLWILLDHLRLSDADNVYEIFDLHKVKVHGDNLEKFSTDWQRILLGMKKPPTDDELESAFRRRLEDSKQFATTLALYNDKYPDSASRNYGTLFKMLDKFIRDKRIRENRNALESRQEGGRKHVNPVVSDGGSQDPLKGMPKDGCSVFWKTGKCKFGDSCFNKHFRNNQRGRSPGMSGVSAAGGGKSGGKGGSKSRTNSPSGRPNSPSKSPTRKRGTSPSGVSDAPSCTSWRKNGYCKDGNNCKYWHAIMCRFHKNKQ